MRLIYIRIYEQTFAQLNTAADIVFRHECFVASILFDLSFKWFAKVHPLKRDVWCKGRLKRSARY